MQADTRPAPLTPSAPLLRAACLGLALLVAFGSLLPTALEGQEYFPPRGDWEVRDPGQVGMSASLLDEAIQFAIEAESTGPRDLALAHQRGFAREPFGEQVGPFKERGPNTGVIIRNGYIVAEWGEPHRIDNTFSVTKSFVATTVGLAWDRGLIPDLFEPVGPLMAPVFAQNPECVAPRAPTGEFPQLAPPFEPFASEHNARVRWDDLLRQTSDWEGMLWCKPDWGDRPSGNADEWLTRERNEPGTAYEYNDTRVNLLALASLNIWRTPLPEVLREHVMDPIGASPTWRWTGYENSWVLIDGRWVESVSGGAHWGGGMFISARDMARFGLLNLHDGRWEGEQLLSEGWLEQARTPGVNPGYGFMNYFLNQDGRGWSEASEGSHYHAGAGSNIIYVDFENDLVVVVRWIRNGALNEFIGKVLAAIED